MDQSRRDQFSWNPRSSQPDVVLTRRERLVEMLHDLPDHGRFAADVLRRAPAVLGRYAREGATWRGRWLPLDLVEGIGMSLSAAPGTVGDVVEAYEELGLGRALVRIPYRAGGGAPWDPAYRATQIELVEELLSRGHHLCIAIPQDREALRSPDQWRAGLIEILDRFRGRCEAFQVGQALNRKKWGCWTVEEAVRLLEPALEYRDRRGQVSLVGPAILDFEFHYHMALSAALARRPNLAAPFDIFAGQLYVDRQGAPEWRHDGFNLLDKAILLSILTECYGYGPARPWITEINWPLRNQGDFAPTGDDVVVDELSYAAYMVRALLIALGLAGIERVYWWQLVARGYGLIEDRGEIPGGDPARWRRRPAYGALAVLTHRLAGRVLVSAAVQGAGWLLRFRGPDDDLLIAWDAGRPRRQRRDLPALQLAQAPRAAVDILGRERALTHRQKLDGTPLLCWVPIEGVASLGGAGRRGWTVGEVGRCRRHGRSTARRPRLRPFSRGGWTGVLAEGPAPLAFSEWLAGADLSIGRPGAGPPPDGAVLHDVRNRLVRLPAPVSAPRWPSTIVVKRFSCLSTWDRLRSLLSPSKALKSYRRAEHLLALGLATPIPLFALERRRWGMVVDALYGTADAGELPRLREIFTRQVAQPDIDATWRAVARATARLHAGGLAFRDLSDGNVLVAPGDDGAPPQLLFVDLNRCKATGRPLCPARAVLDVLRLGLPRDVVPDFLAALLGRRYRLWHLWIYRLAKWRFVTWKALRRRMKERRRRAGGGPPRARNTT